MDSTPFLIEFRHAAGAEILCADRIQADGSGNLVLYRGSDRFRSLNLGCIQDLRIWPSSVPKATIQ